MQSGILRKMRMVEIQFFFLNKNFPFISNELINECYIVHEMYYFPSMYSMLIAFLVHFLLLFTDKSTDFLFRLFRFDSFIKTSCQCNDVTIYEFSLHYLFEKKN